MTERIGRKQIAEFVRPKGHWKWVNGKNRKPEKKRGKTHSGHRGFWISCQNAKLALNSGKKPAADSRPGEGKAYQNNGKCALNSC